MRAKRILVVSIALFVASCATLTKVQGPATPSSPAQGDGGPPGVGSERQGPSLDGVSASQPDDRATGVKADAFWVIGGQLFTSAPR